MDNPELKIDEAGRVLPPNTEQLDEALFFALDTLEAILPDFFPMGNTAIQMVNDLRLEGDRIQLGVREKDLAPSILETLKIVDPNIDITDKKIIMIYEGVPIEIKRIKKHYRVLDNLDQIVYAYETFWIGNPISSFLLSTRFMH